MFGIDRADTGLPAVAANTSSTTESPLPSCVKH
jgi:hypothetical protein